MILKAPIDKLLAIEWSHCVDFKEGLDALYDIKETVEVLGGTVQAMMKGKIDDAISLVMGSGALISCLEVLNPDMLRKMLKTAFQPAGVKMAIQKAMEKMPAELQHPFEDLLAFADELDMNDLDAIVADFVALCKQFKVKIPKKLAELRAKAEKKGQEVVSGSSFGSSGAEMSLIVAGSNLGSVDIPDFNFPGDILTSIDPMEILSLLASEIPPPFDTAYAKAMEMAAFAPLLPMVEHLKDGNLEGAQAIIMTTPVLKLVKKFDLEMPRNLLKKLLLSNEVKAAVQRYKAMMPQDLQAPFAMLQQFSQQLDGNMDTIFLQFQEVVSSFKVFDVAGSNFTFPQDLLKAINPIDVLELLGEKIPPPMDVAFKKALKLAAYAPLLPIIDRIKSKDLQGAAEQVMSAGMLKVTQNLDTELPRKILKSVLQNNAVTTAIQQAQSQMPQLGAPLQKLQQLAQQLDGDISDILAKFEDVFNSLKGQANFNFPGDLMYVECRGL